MCSDMVKMLSLSSVAAIVKQIDPLREKLRRAKDVLEESPHVYELLKNEHELERKARNRYLERSR